MKKIKEVIVVEGKDDTKRIQRAVDADTIETRGSAIPGETLDLIKRLLKTVVSSFSPTLTFLARRSERQFRLRFQMPSTHLLPRGKASPIAQTAHLG